MDAGFVEPALCDSSIWHPKKSLKLASIGHQQERGTVALVSNPNSLAGSDARQDAWSIQERQQSPPLLNGEEDSSASRKPIASPGPQARSPAPRAPAHPGAVQLRAACPCPARAAPTRRKASSCVMEKGHEFKRGQERTFLFKARPNVRPSAASSVQWYSSSLQQFTAQECREAGMAFR